MRIERFVTNPIEENAYIVSEGGEAALIDPGGAEKEILKSLSGQKLRFILLTHCHFDHTYAADYLRKKTLAPIYISRADFSSLLSDKGSGAARFGAPYTPFSADGALEDMSLSIGGRKIETLPTPGHTLGSVCFKIDSCLFSGDTLFEGTIGNFERENLEIMKKSVLGLMTLPDEMRVFPGHGNITTIAREKLINPYSNHKIWESI